MRVERIQWRGPWNTAVAARIESAGSIGPIDVDSIRKDVRHGDDATLMKLTRRFDATESPPPSLKVSPSEVQKASATLDPAIRRAMETAIANVRSVAEAQLVDEPNTVVLPQGQTVSTRQVPVPSAGIYAPGGRAAYPSSVIMCAVPAGVAGVSRIALASPPQPDGRVNPLVLAAAGLCGIKEIYAVGGAQAIFALAYGTQTVERVHFIAGPGNSWVREAKRAVYGVVGIDSLAGPSELLLIAGGDANPEWAALDLCAQAEHGLESPLVALSVDGETLEAIAAEAERIARERPSVNQCRLQLIEAPSLDDALEFANVFSPEHLELHGEDVAKLKDRVTSAGCVFVGGYSATAFGDYVAGSNHVLPTAGAGAFSGPLSANAFRRSVVSVELSPEAAAKLAPHADAIARAEGFPVHGESAMIRAEGDR